jgi:hypothetical protein
MSVPGTEVSILVTGPVGVSQKPVMGGVSLEKSGKSNMDPSQTSVGTMGKNVGVGDGNIVTGNDGGILAQATFGVN